jgi:SdpI/YhfL family protein
MTVFEKGLITILGCAFVFAALAIPLMLRKVPRNVIYGFRTRTTLSSDSIWYEANAHFGRGLLAASIVSALAICVLVQLDFEPRTFLNLSVVVLVVPAAIATLRTASFIRLLTRKSDRGAATS